VHLEGSVTINTAREKVWTFLNDPNAVSKCAPGLESLEIITPDQKFRVVVSVGFGTVKATFNTDVEWLEREPMDRLKFKAHGSAPGSAVDASADVRLSDGAGGATDLNWAADIVVLGTIASLASRLMGGVTQRLTTAFFDCARKQIEA
jgi:carbon monoxide dehydrogenase subunit G